MSGESTATAAPSRWPTILAAVVCVGVLGAVVAFALLQKGRHEDASDGGRLVGPGAGNGEGLHRAMRPEPPTGLEGCVTTDLSRLPVLEFDLPDDTLDFGAVRQGERREREVVFRNSGPGLLCATHVNTGCGCLKVKFKNPGKRRFNKGEEGIIVVVLDTKDQEGIVEKKVTVRTNDPQAPLREFRMRCDVSEAVVASPSAVSFGRPTRGAAVTAELLLKSPLDDPEWTVKEVVGTRRHARKELVAYTFELDRVQQNDPRFRMFRLRIRHPGMPVTGPFRDGIVIRTTHPDRPEILIQAHIDVTARVWTRPIRLPFGFVRPGAPRPATTVDVLTAPGIEVEIRRVEITAMPGRDPLPGGDGGFVAVPRKEKGRTWVDVSYRGQGTSAQAGHLEAMLEIHTSDPEVPILRVPLSARIKKAR